MKIKLTMVTGMERVAVRQNEDEDGFPVTQEGSVTEPAETTCPVMVETDDIRCFYPRKGNRQGTRLTFKNSAGMAVIEPFEDVCRMFQVH